MPNHSEVEVKCLLIIETYWNVAADQRAYASFGVEIHVANTNALLYFHRNLKCDKRKQCFPKPLMFSFCVSYLWRVAIICSTIKNDLNYACFDLLWLLHIFNATHTFTHCFFCFFFCFSSQIFNYKVQCALCAMLIVIPLPLPIQTFKLSLAQIHIY